MCPLSAASIFRSADLNPADCAIYPLSHTDWVWIFMFVQLQYNSLAICRGGLDSGGYSSWSLCWKSLVKSGRKGRQLEKTKNRQQSLTTIYHSLLFSITPLHKRSYPDPTSIKLKHSRTTVLQIRIIEQSLPYLPSGSRGKSAFLYCTAAAQIFRLNEPQILHNYRTMILYQIPLEAIVNS